MGFHNSRFPLYARGNTRDGHHQPLFVRISLNPVRFENSTQRKLTDLPYLFSQFLNGCGISAFTLSTYIALLYMTFSRPFSEINAFDPTILAYLCFFGLVFTQFSFLHPDANSSLRGAVLNFILVYAVCGYEIWFTFVGINKMQPACYKDGDDNPAATAFTVRKAVAVLIIVAICVHVIRCLWLTASALRERRRHKTRPLILAEKLRLWLLFQVTDRSNTNNVKMPPVVFYALSFIAIAALVTFIPLTEVLIHRNHAQGVTTLGSTGQLIPLIVGGTGLIDVSCKVLKKWWNKHNDPDSGKGSGDVGLDTTSLHHGNSDSLKNPHQAGLGPSEFLVKTSDEESWWGNSYIPIPKDNRWWTNPPTH